MVERVGEGREGEGAAAVRKNGAVPSRISWRRPTPAALSRIAAALCLTVILGGCGIEEYTYFYKPIAGEDPILKFSSFSFAHNTSNSSSDFFGYEIYYMLVDANNTDVVSKISTLDSYISGASKTPSEIIALMKSYGFKSLIGLDASKAIVTNQPLFYISSSGLGKSIDFSLSINSTGESTVSVTGDGASYVTAPSYVRRNSLNTSTGSYRDFTNLTKDDISSGGDTAYESSSPEMVLFRGYIFGYGMTSSFSDVYSYPVQVGACYTSDISNDSIVISGSFTD